MEPNKRFMMFTMLALATSAALVAACGDKEKSDPTSLVIDRLHECGLVSSQGEINLVFTSEDDCQADCFLSASCEEGKGAVCGGLEDAQGKSYPRSDSYDQCMAKCDSFGPCDGKELPRSAHCDGVDDCSDGRDEAKCFVHECPDGTKLTSPLAIQCDGYDDCEDASDEAGCKDNKFKCKDGRTLPASSECDLVPDCLDESDEHEGCAQPVCE